MTPKGANGVIKSMAIVCQKTHQNQKGTSMKNLVLAALLGGLAVTAAFAQSKDIKGSTPTSGYVLDPRGNVVVDPFALCWRDGYFTPAMAINECDPDLVPKKVAAAPPPPPMPAPKVMPPAPPPPPPPPAPPKPCNFEVTLNNDSVFAYNKSVLTDAAKIQLDGIIKRADACAKVNLLVVTGHTDRIGTAQYNQKLSEARAETVKAYLVSKGLQPAAVETLGVGKTMQIKGCAEVTKQKDLIDCLAPNRRVVIEIKGPGR
jgi:OOP family OmpA-OmpF porin